MYDLLLVYISFSLTSTIVHSRKLWKPSHLCVFSREENLIMFQKSQLHQVSMNFSCHVPRAAPTNPTFREEQNLSLMITTTQLSLLFNKQGKGLNTVRIPILNHQCSSYDTCIMDTSIWIHTYWIMNTSSWVTPLEHPKYVEGPIPSCRGLGVRWSGGSRVRWIKNLKFRDSAFLPIIQRRGRGLAIPIFYYIGSDV